MHARSLTIVGTLGGLCFSTIVFVASAGPLEKARAWLGPESARAAVKSLEVLGTEKLTSGPTYPYHFKLMLPDKHWMAYPGGIAHVVNGKDTWSVSTSPLPLPLAPAAPMTLERRQYPMQFHAIQFLLMALPQSKVTFSDRGSGASHGLVGALIDVRLPEAKSMTLIGDPGDGHVIGLTKPVTRTGNTFGPSEDTEVVRFDDFRTVRGVKFPFRIVSESFGITNTLVIDTIKVNEGVSASDFVKR